MQAIASALATLGRGCFIFSRRERPLEPELHGNLMPAYTRHHAAEQAHRGDVLILHRWRALDPSPCLRGHRRAISLTTIFDEHYPTLCNMASRADERMVLDTTYSHCMVRDHLRQDQLSATGNTTRHSHTKPHAEAPPGHEEYRSFAPGC